MILTALALGVNKNYVSYNTASAQEQNNQNESIINQNLKLSLLVSQAQASGFISQENPIFKNNNLSGNLLVSNAGPSTGNILNNSGIIIYQVEPGDTLPSIANYFNISVQTILWANPQIIKNRLYKGENLIILPISGVIHQVQAGETWSSIAQEYNINVSDLENANKNVDILAAGVNIIIPNGQPINDLNNQSTNLPNIKNYFIAPAKGLISNVINSNNTVRIANECGTSIKASAEGLVSQAVSDNGFNNGDGNYVVIEHPNGTETHYAHLNQVKVSIGDYVKQGQVIGTMGETGSASSCYLDFKVIGALNPFIKKL